MTVDLGYMINHAMFQRNQRAGLVLKPLALRTADKSLLAKRTQHFLDITIISAQQLPRAKDATGREILGIVDPYVEVSIHVPEWHLLQRAPGSGSGRDSPFESGEPAAKRVFVRTGTVRANGFNPVWEERLRIPFSVAGGEDMYDLIFVRFEVKQEAGTADEDDMPLAVYCSSLGALARGKWSIISLLLCSPDEAIQVTAISPFTTPTSRSTFSPLSSCASASVTRKPPRYLALLP